MRLSKPVLASCWFGLSLKLAAATVYVDGVNGSDEWDGSSPQLAKASIQAGIDAAAASGDTVSVAPAKYFLSAPIVNNASGTKVQLVAQSDDPRDTVIDGDGRFTCINFTVPGSTIAGFTITNGCADASAGLSPVGGGGIRLSKGATVSNCVITCCRAVNAGNAEVCGGGILANGGAIAYVFDRLLIENCAAVSTSGKVWLRGGGFCAKGPGVMRNCTIRDCEVKIDGGTSTAAMAIGGGGAGEANTAGGLSVSNCVFTGNSIVNAAGGDYGNGGGLYLSGLTGHAAVDDSLIAGNRAGYYGSGLYLDNAAASRITVSNNVLSSTANVGSGIYATGASCAIVSSAIVGNSGIGGAGIALIGGGCISNCYFRANSKNAVNLLGNTADPIEIVQCRFERNPGGEISGKARALTIRDCTFDDAEITRASPMIALDASKSAAGETLSVRNCRFAEFSGERAIRLGSLSANWRAEFDSCTFARIANTRYQTFSVSSAEFVELRNLLFAGNTTTGSYANPDIPAAFENYPDNLRCNLAVAADALLNPDAGDYRPRRRCGAMDAGVHSPWMDGAFDLGAGTFLVEKNGNWGVDLVRVEANRRLCGSNPDVGCCEIAQRNGLLLLIK